MLKCFKKRGTLIDVEDLILLEMGYEIILVDDVEKAFKDWLLDFSDTLNSDDDILI